ncbi:MAG: phospholipid carrier-dependent glycosyltransferase [Anaerolineaceae bacterium]|nr:phospholipid carrier-dependent glycosyltransferase [Anaerolineaceae bacterium]
MDGKLAHLGLVVLAVWLFFFLALNSLVQDSPTMDEQNHLARGAAFVHTADPRLSLEHPPLVNSLSGLPLLLLPDLVYPFDHPSWTEMQPPDIYWYNFADQFVWRVNQDVTRMIFLGRLPMVFLTLGLALVGFHFARLFWGRPSAYLAFVLLLFEPNVLGNGRLITTDLGGTLFMTLALLLVWRMWTAPGWNWRRWLAAGVGLGLAFGSKLSMLAFVPILLVLAFLPIFEEGTQSCTEEAQRGTERWRRFLQLVSAGALSVGVVWAIFGFEWGAFRFPSEVLAGLNRFSGPMPTFWAGLDQIVNVSRGGRAAFLLGETSLEGFWLFFPVAFLVKTPLVLLFGLVGVIVWGWKRPSSRPKLLYLLIPALLYFGVSVVSGINIGYRHLLPIVPLIIVAVSGLPTFLGSKLPRTERKWRGGDTGHSRVIALVLAGGILLPTLLIHPHYLSYFNLAAGGSANGASILADSSNDWGQDLLRLQAWMAENDVETINLGWFGIADPAYYGLVYEPLPGFPRAEFLSLWDNPPFDPQAPGPGLYAISASSLWESHRVEKHVYTWFRQREADVRIGSIYVYVIE